MDRIRIVVRDGELGIALPLDVVKRWKLRDGDHLDCVEAAGGLYLRPMLGDAELERELVEEILRENSDVLRKLAQ
ncbi:MAG: hypothetical protein HZA53_13955 [Planctomycetes bacterium]|nr:hypothetical protein [Planctomycetota bacterium]